MRRVLQYLLLGLLLTALFAVVAACIFIPWRLGVEKRAEGLPIWTPFRESPSDTGARPMASSSLSEGQDGRFDPDRHQHGPDLERLTVEQHPDNVLFFGYP